MLAAQGLLETPSKPSTKRLVLDQIRRMGALQIDTISVVARSPYLVLWSRLGDYRPIWLDQLLAERKIFEYWAHAACFLPIEDYPLYRRQMTDPHSIGWQYSHDWVTRNRQEIDRVLTAIRERGPMRSIEFEAEQPRVPGWWEWKPSKRALEMLFTAGELMIARRENFHRVYDLRERIMPDWEDSATPSRDEVVLRLTEKAVRALGVTTAEWTGDYFRLPRKDGVAAVRELVAQGVLLAVSVSGWDRPAYFHRDHLALARQASRGRSSVSKTTLLSPFDPIVWDRSRAVATFDFDYRLECYTPEAKRKYGYFTLPILYRSELVGRVDAKAHRREGELEVRAVHLEPEFSFTEDFAHELAITFRQFGEWMGTPRVRIGRAAPGKFRVPLQAALKRTQPT